MVCVLWYAVSQKNWLLLGALNANCGSARLIHGTGINTNSPHLHYICMSIYMRWVQVTHVTPSNNFLLDK